MSKATVTITQFEPVVYLRGQSASGEDSRGRRRHVDFDAPPSQLRGILTLYLPKPSKIKDISISFSGTAKTDWPEGIGPNRLELAEETPIIKQVVNLFNAKTEGAQLGRRRCNSVGPGIELDEDVDWDLAPRPSGSASGGASYGDAEETTTATLARSITNVAARAGNAMLPTTLRTDLQSSKGKNKQPPSVVNDRTGASSAPLSPWEARPFFNGDRKKSGSLPRPTSGAKSRSLGAGSLSKAARRSPTATIEMPNARTPLPGSSIAAASKPRSVPYEPPPMYEPRSSDAESGGLSAQTSSDPACNAGTAESASNSEGSGSTGWGMGLGQTNSTPGTPDTSYSSPSVSWAASGSGSLGTGAYCGSSPVQTQHASDGVSPFSASPAVHTSVANESPFERSFAASTASKQTPESVLEAGPSGRSILHQPGQPRQRETDRPSAAGVRFNPADIAAAACASVAASSSNRGSAPNSAPSSRRSSADVGNAQLSFGAPPMERNSSADGGWAANGRSSSPSTSYVATSPVVHKDKGKKPGIKGLIGGLLKDEKEGKGKEKEKEGKGKEKEKDGARGKDKDEEHQDWKEFKKGTYTYPISIPLPSNLPPTLHADFGSNAYVLRAFVHRAGALTSNLSTEREVTLVHAPDEDGMEETDAIVVQRNWEDALSYMVVLYGKSFPVGGKIPLWLKFVPIDKVRIHRVVGTIEEKTDYFAKGRRVARHEVPRRWTVLKLVNPDPNEPLLPLSATDPTILNTSPLTELARAAGATSLEESETVPALLDATGPWEIFTDLDVPTCSSTRINISTSHTRSNIAVHHIVRLAIRVERVGASSDSTSEKLGPDDQPPKKQLFDIIIEAPLALTHSRTAEAWTSLPNYWSVADDPDTNEVQQQRPANLPADAPMPSAATSSAPSKTTSKKLSRFEASRHADGPCVPRRIVLPTPTSSVLVSPGATMTSTMMAPNAPRSPEIPRSPNGVVGSTSGGGGGGGVVSSMAGTGAPIPSPREAQELSMRWLTLSSSSSANRRRADSLPQARGDYSAGGTLESEGVRGMEQQQQPDTAGAEDGGVPPPSYAATTAGEATLALGEAPLANRAPAAQSELWGAAM